MLSTTLPEPLIPLQAPVPPLTVNLPPPVNVKKHVAGLTFGAPVVGPEPDAGPGTADA